jgi:hypothetical protein
MMPRPINYINKLKHWADEIENYLSVAESYLEGLDN